MASLLDRIMLDPELGRPFIRDTRIGVADILGMLAVGEMFADILGDHPDLETDDIRACCAYAADVQGISSGARSIVLSDCDWDSSFRYKKERSRD